MRTRGWDCIADEIIGFIGSTFVEQRFEGIYLVNYQRVSRAFYFQRSFVALASVSRFERLLLVGLSGGLSSNLRHTLERDFLLEQTDSWPAAKTIVKPSRAGRRRKHSGLAVIYAMKMIRACKRRMFFQISVVSSVIREVQVARFHSLSRAPFLSRFLFNSRAFDR